jgi:nucleoside-diphosphate-sugar epimerase
MRRFAITGGTGFLGQEIARQCAEAGYEVRLVSRGRLATGEIPKHANLRVCDIHDATALQHIFEGCECVVHCAALSSPWGRRRDFIDQNVIGTACTVKAAEAAQVQRFIHVSSSSVYFSFRDQLDIDETFPLPRPVNAYAESKQLAEREATKFSRELFIIRPRGIFGPNDPHLLPRLLRVMKTRPLPLLNGGNALVDLTDVAMVADAIMCMMIADETTTGTYNVSQGEPIRIKTLVETIGRHMRIKPRWRELPIPLAMAGAHFLETCARLDPRQHEPIVTAYSLGLFAYSQTLNIRAAQRNLSWRPRLSLQHSLERALQSVDTGET